MPVFVGVGRPADDRGWGVIYDAFVSYSHAADSLLAPKLQDGLQRFAKPWYRRRALDVFRDTTGLSVNPGLWSSITAVMDESEWFVLLASPEAAQSEWVAREIEHWCTTRPVERILPVLTDGEWVWDAEANDFDWARSTAVPAALAAAYAEEPRHVDMRWARTEEQLDLRNGRFRDQVAEVAAPMHGVAKDELAGEDVRQHRRALRLAWFGGTALAIATLFAVIAAALALGFASRARDKESEATRALHTVETRNETIRRTNDELAQTNTKLDNTVKTLDTRNSDLRKETQRATDNERQAIQNEQDAVEAQDLAEQNAQEADAATVLAEQNARELAVTNDQLTSAKVALEANNEQLAAAVAAAQFSEARAAAEAAEAAEAAQSEAAAARRAEASRRDAVATTLSGEAGRLLDERADTAVLLAAQSWRIAGSSSAKSAARRGLLETVDAAAASIDGFLPPPSSGEAGALTTAAVSNDGSRVAAGDIGQIVGAQHPLRILAWDPRDSSQPRTLRADAVFPARPAALTLDAQGEILLSSEISIDDYTLPCLPDFGPIPISLVRVWAVDAEKVVYTSELPVATWQSSPDGKHAVIEEGGCADIGNGPQAVFVMRFVDLTTGEVSAPILAGLGHNTGGSDFTPDSGYAVGATDGWFGLWSLQDPTHPFTPIYEAVDGARAPVIGADGTIIAVPGSQEVRELEFCVGDDGLPYDCSIPMLVARPIQQVAIGGGRVVVLDTSGGVTTFALGSSAPIYTVPPNGLAYEGIRISPGGRHFVRTTPTGQSYVSSAASGDLEVWTNPGPLVAFGGADERYALIETGAQSDAALGLLRWDFQLGGAVWQDPNQHQTLVASADGSRVAVFGSGAAMRVVGVDQSSEVYRPAGAGRVAGVAFYRDNRVLGVGLGDFGIVWSAEPRPQVAAIDVIDDPPTPPRPGAATCADGRHRAFTRDGTSVEVRDIQTQAERIVFQAAAGEEVSFLMCSRTPFVGTAHVLGIELQGSNDALATVVVNVETGATMARLPHGLVALSSDARHVVTRGESAARVQVWEIAPATAPRPRFHVDISSLDPVDFPNLVLAIDDEGTLLAGTNTIGRVVVWELPTSSTGRVLYDGRVGGSFPFAGIAVDRDGTKVAAKHPDGTVRLFVRQGWKRASIRQLDPGRALVRVGFSPDASLLEVEGQLLLDGETLEPVRSPILEQNFFDPPTATVFSSDGAALLMERDGSSGVLYRYTVNADALARRACGIAGRNLTQQEWDEFLPDDSYEKTCS